MTDDKTGAAGGARRKPSTIDLKATEIASEPAKPTDLSDVAQEIARAEASASASASARSAVPPEAAKTEPPKTEAPKSELPKSELPKSEPPKPPEAKPEPVSTVPKFPEAKPAESKSTEPRPSEPKSPEPTKAPPSLPPPSGGSGWGAVAAGAVGAGIMLAAGLAVFASGVMTPPDRTTPRIAQLESRLGELANRPQPVADPRPLNDLTARVATAEQASQRLAALEARVARAEQSVTRVGELEQRITKSEGVAANARPITDQALADRIMALETALKPFAEVPARIEAANDAARDAKTRADVAVETMQKTQGAVAADHQAIEALTPRVAALEQAAKIAQERIAATAGADRAGRLAFMAVALRAAVERGEAFTAELTAVKPLANANTLAALEPFAVTGVPRNAALARELSSLTNTMLSAAGSNSGASLMDRLQQNAERLVRIRPVSEMAGDDPATIVTRADVKATHGDLAGALAEVKSLPAAVRLPAEGWIKKVEAQTAALAAARNLAEGAVGALAKP